MRSFCFRLRIALICKMGTARAVFVLVGSLMLGGCSEGAKATTAVAWQLQCEGQGGCSGYQTRRVSGGSRVDEPEGEQSFQCVSQDVVERNAILIDRLRWFGRDGTGRYELRIDNLLVGASGGGPIAPGCTVRVVEDDEYEGACGVGFPSEDAACQINLSRIGGSAGTRLLEGSVQCFGLRGLADNRRIRELGAPPEEGGGAVTLLFDQCD